MGSYRCGDGGVAIGLEAVAELFASIEGSLDAGDWDALGEARPSEPEVTPADEAELCRLIAEADRLQRLIASYMDQVHHDLEMAPHVRRATTAYIQVEGLA